MKKLISVLLALAMLLSACAMAAGREVTLSNIRYSDNSGTELDFSGIEIKLAAAEAEDKAGASVALSADGSELLRAVLSADEMGAYLSATGISDVYSIPREMMQEMVTNSIPAVDMEQMAANMEQMTADAAVQIGRMVGIVTENVESAGTYENEGVVYDAYSFDVSHEQFMELVDIVDEFLAKYPDVFPVDLGGYASMREMFEAEGVKVRYDGEVYYAENGCMVDLYAYADEEALMNLFIDLSTSHDEATGVITTDIYFGFFDPTEENSVESLAYILVSLYTKDETGELRSVEISFGSGEDESDAIYAALSLVEDEEYGMKYFTLGAMDGSVDFTVLWGESNGAFNVKAVMKEAETETELEMDYEYKDGNGLLSLVARAEGDEINISSDITVTEDDGAWLPEIGETVNILEIGEDQIEKLMTEGEALLMKLLVDLTAANEDIALLLVELM